MELPVTRDGAEALPRLRYDVSLEDLIAFYRFHLRGSTALVVGLALTVGLGGGPPGWVLVGSVFVFGALYLLEYPVVHRRRVERMTRWLVNEGRNDSVLCEHVLEITPEWLVDRTPVSETKAAWSIIERIEKTDTHTFVYTQAQGAHIPPR